VYTAPELILAARSNAVTGAPPCYASYGPAVDCWAFGLVAFKLLTGYDLFRSVADAVPPETDEGMDGDDTAWHTQYMADLHAEWVRARPNPFREPPPGPWDMLPFALLELVVNPHVRIASCSQPVSEMYLGMGHIQRKTSPLFGDWRLGQSLRC
jgi:hypothetical protein